MLKLVKVLLVVTSTGLLPAAAGAETYPSKPVRVVVPFGPGSGTDSVARILSNALQKSLGQPFVVVNKPGADGSIAGIDIARSAPDGYSVFVATSSPLGVAPFLRKVAPYDPIADFTSVSLIGEYSFFIVTNPKLPVNSVAELVAYAKGHPGKINYATGNTTGIVATGLFAANTGIDITQIPYKTEPEAIPDLLTGQVDMMISSYSTVAPHVGVGKLKALATTLPKRHPLLPDVPAMNEGGLPDLPLQSWAALVAPAKLPPEIVAILNKATVEALASKEVIEQLQNIGFAGRSSTPEQFTEQLKRELPIWKAALEKAKIEPQ